MRPLAGYMASQGLMLQRCGFESRRVAFNSMEDVPVPSKFERCRRCGEYSWSICDCKRYELARKWQPTSKVADADWREVYGRDPERIVERWAERYDAQGDYTIVGGSEADVWLRDEDGTLTEWTVRGETVPQYHANEVTTVSAGERTP